MARIYLVMIDGFPGMTFVAYTKAKEAKKHAAKYKGYHEDGSDGAEVWSAPLYVKYKERNDNA